GTRPGRRRRGRSPAGRSGAVSLLPLPVSGPGALSSPDGIRDLEDFRAEVREWVLTRLVPHATEWEARRCFPTGVLREMGRRGYLGLSVSPEAGGQGRSLWYEVVLAEELMKARMLGFALSLALHAFVCVPCLDDLGRSTPEVAATLRAAVRGERV